MNFVKKVNCTCYLPKDAVDSVHKYVSELGVSTKDDSIPLEIEISKILSSEKRGQIIGSVKALADCSTDKNLFSVNEYDMNGIYPINQNYSVSNYISKEIKLFVRSIVNNNDSFYNQLYQETTVIAKYKHFLATVCGVGTPHQAFNTDIFERIFPNDSGKFIQGFVKGYSKIISILASSANIKYEYTDPIMEDIWRNWDYFLVDGQKDYHLCGEYILLNTKKLYSDQPDTRFVNPYLYDALSSRLKESQKSNLVFYTSAAITL